jgi:hypothetical protein
LRSGGISIRACCRRGLCCAHNPVRRCHGLVTAWRERLAFAVGSRKCCASNRSLEGVRSSPLLHFAVGGFTKFGCSTSRSRGRHG